MGANQSSAGSNAPVGTNFKAVQKDREKYGDVDLLEIIPLNKQKEAGAEIDMTVKQSKYMTAYKQEFRNALKRKKGKGHDPKLNRLYDKSLHAADDTAGKTHSRRSMINHLVDNITPVVKDDIIDGLKEEGRKGSKKELGKEADAVIFKLIHERVHDRINDKAAHIFKKFQQGGDFMASDGEDDEDEEAKAERARSAAKQRAYEAEAWLAELNGEEPPPKPKKGDDEEEEEEYEEDEEEEEGEE
ncbi:hypothetical protein DIPPA_04068 [Diplonema papillatum]|nr:hypothetical protein DIPPA_04068 [Diplonema papillatum]